jgi:UPF0271 protein
MTLIDLNADLGEGVSGDPGLEPERLDDLLLHEVTSANVACGGHAGDDASMSRVCHHAAELGVAIGAQVSYADRAGFGRVRLDVPRGVLVGQLVEQVATLRAHARTAGSDVSYLKPHGALYNAAADDAQVARAVVEAVLADAGRTGTSLPVLTLPGCALATAADERGVAVVAEAFADRAYTRTGRLVPRTEPDAVIGDEHAVVERVVRLATQGLVRSVDGVDVEVRARSVCLHSDTPGAARTAALVRRALRDAGVEVRRFAAQP